MATNEYQPRPDGRPRTKSMLSFGSHKSIDASPKQKLDLTESPREKAHRRMTSKADPTKAMNELQPGQAQFEKSTIDNLRSMQHKDSYGNVITDPDASNPTRPRLERPLDTIRSFEAAINGGYRSRNSMRPGTSEAGYTSRRSSYYQGAQTPQPRVPPHSGHHGWNSHPAAQRSYAYGGGSHSRPESYVEGYAQGQNYSQTPPPFQNARRAPPRNQSDPMLYGPNSNGLYSNNYHQSYESANSGSGSGYSHGADAWGNSTDPSSENSSVDRAAPQPPPKHQDLGEQYGFSGFGVGPDLQQDPIMEEGGAYPDQSYGQGPPNGYGQHTYGYNGQPAMQNGAYPSRGGGHELPPPPPPHANGGGMRPRPPSKLQSSRRAPSYDDYGAPQQMDNSEKRKSWLKRRFSKNN